MESVLTVRMDSAMKERGASVMRRCGYTPSAAVRRLFEYAAKNDGLPFDAPAELTKEEKLRRIAAFDACHTKKPLAMTDRELTEERLSARYGLDA